MKKTLLSLSFLLGLGLQGYSQTFTPQNSTLAPDYQFQSIQAIDANTAWGLAGTVVGTSLNANTYVRTSNGGTTWQGGIISPTGLSGYTAGGMYALDANTAWAAMYHGSDGTGLIAKTTDGGATWVPQTTPGAATTPGVQFGSPNGFANWVHFFDAQNGVCQGDPNRTATSSVNFFELYTTNNGGTTWTRVPRTANNTPLNANEYGVVSQYYAVGNTVWFTTLFQGGTGAPPITTPSRVFKSTDRGLTWVAPASTGIPTSVSGIAFAGDAQHGLAYDGTGNLVRSNDGGATWAPQAYSTPFHRYDVSGVRGTNAFVSAGLDGRVTTPTANTEFGISISTDFGATWKDIDTGTSYTAISFASPSVGYAGGFSSTTGGGAIGKYTGSNVLSNRNTELQKSLSVYPNPSSNGIFTVQLASGLKSGASVRVFDVVGRQVAAQTLNATAIAAKATTVDLSNEKAGIYTLELRTEAGVAQQKLVVE
ncbi:T9SS type A sorting domain-containing protein [Hymenobacter psychrotolerans]|uniref:Por secretion system C-terminal sorting domain-containing protein n=1 Tax=Hymenobacter psychrotolerans DSM 18569 TaxID=1121959 RepID=A0A1M7DYE0_9BACT|nr:T9SS type A sorting domain-containing protein [Hymenobacter psychrotolerans]SHL84189.1 Por secretion system C-terminal sorting domain-containing protein [Hymenobacter psychrotolerans DSM 18569]